MLLKKICNFISVIILIVLTSFAMILFVPQLFGYKNYVVVSGSMEPTIPVGSAIYVKSFEFEEYQIGDIISYNVNDNTIITHRIVDITSNNQFITKGDANDTNDISPVDFNNIIGKEVFCIPLLGYLIYYIKTPLGIAFGCAIIFVMILLNFIPDLFIQDKKKN